MNRKSKDTKRAKSNQTLRMRGPSVRDVVLPWDSKEEFERLHRELTAELSPHGRMEEDIVLDVAILRWRKYQLAKWRRTAALKDPYFIELLESGKKSWSGIRKYLREQEEAYKTVRGKLINVLSKLTDAATELAHAQKAKGMEEEVERTEQKISDIMKAVSEHVIPLLQAIDGGPSAEKTFEQACLPESFERVLKCGAAIDSRIDKLLGRLVSLKEYKRVYGAQTLLLPKIKSPPTVTELAELTAGH
jgi:hypothetical protein